MALDIMADIGLPDLPYFTGDPVFQRRKEAARETKSPVLDYTQ